MSCMYTYKTSLKADREVEGWVFFVLAVYLPIYLAIYPSINQSICPIFFIFLIANPRLADTRAYHSLSSLAAFWQSLEHLWA